MNAVLVLAAAAFLQQPALERFSFCKESPGGEYEDQCFELDADGRGVFRFTVSGADPVEAPFAFSTRGLERFRELLRATDNLAEADRYESGRRVANMGTKTIVAEGSWGRREAAFNYSEIEAARELSTFFERMISQEMLVFGLELALEFDRLGVPERLEVIEREADSGRLPDPDRLVPVLERIESASGLVNYAKTMATRLKERLIEAAD